jgi:hypothetical protein
LSCAWEKFVPSRLVVVLTSLLGVALIARSAQLVVSLAPAEAGNPVTDGVRFGTIPPVLYDHLPALAAGHGVVVEEVQAGSVLGQVGLHKHDILLSCDGVRIRDAKHLARMLSPATQVHQLALLRAGREMTLAVPPAADPLPKGLLKAGGPPAVSVEAQPLDAGKLRVVLHFYSPRSGKLERVTCSGSLVQIEDDVRKMGEQNRMPARVQDLVDVALKRIRALNAAESP